MLQSKIEELLQGKAKEINLPTSVYNELLQYRQKVDKEFDGYTVYAQGSLRLGTIIKPYTKTDDSLFDIDLIAENSNLLDGIDPKTFKMQAKKTIDGVIPEDKKPCWSYKIDSRFHVDVVPAKHKGINNSLSWSEHSIDITKRNDNHIYKWDPSNPKGYYYWFKDINHRVFGNSYENIQPIDNYDFNDRQLKRLIRTNLQKAIQVTKWISGKYFDGKQNEDYKPISIILTTLIAGIFDYYDYGNRPELTIETILEDFVSIMEDMKDEKSHLMAESYYSKRNIVKTIKAMSRNDNKWYIPNPTNSAENFADKWNDPIDGAEKVAAFFEFIDYLDKILKNEIELSRALYSTPINKMSERKPYGH